MWRTAATARNARLVERSTHRGLSAAGQLRELVDGSAGTVLLGAEREQPLPLLRRLPGRGRAVSRAEEGHLELRRGSVLVRELIDSAERAVRPAFAAKEVRLELGSCVDARVVADAERVGQVLTNLLTNALRHTPAGGEVTMSASRASADVQLVVQDTGEGLDPDQLTHVFERFYRGDAARTRDARGSGVGLTIAKAIAEAHGGRLTAASPGREHGATFTLSLPAAG